MSECARVRRPSRAPQRASPAHAYVRTHAYTYPARSLTHPPSTTTHQHARAHTHMHTCTHAHTHRRRTRWRREQELSPAMSTLWRLCPTQLSAPSKRGSFLCGTRTRCPPDTRHPTTNSKPQTPTPKPQTPDLNPSAAPTQLLRVTSSVSPCHVLRLVTSCHALSRRDPLFQQRVASRYEEGGAPRGKGGGVGAADACPAPPAPPPRLLWWRPWRRRVRAWLLLEMDIRAAPAH